MLYELSTRQVSFLEDLLDKVEPEFDVLVMDLVDTIQKSFKAPVSSGTSFEGPIIPDTNPDGSLAGHVSGPPEFVHPLLTPGMDDIWWVTNFKGQKIVFFHDPYLNPNRRVTADGREIQITGTVVRYRDGGTTIIPTELGEITYPSPLSGSVRSSG